MGDIAKVGYELTNRDRQVINRMLRELSEYTDDAVRIISKATNKNKVAPHEEKRASLADDISRLDKLVPDSPTPKSRLFHKITKYLEDRARGKGQEKIANLERGRKLLRSRVLSGKLTGPELIQHQDVLKALDPKNIKKVAPDARSTSDVVRKVLPRSTYAYPSDFTNISRAEREIMDMSVGEQARQHLRSKLDTNLKGYYTGHKPERRETFAPREGKVKSMETGDTVRQFLAYNTITEATPRKSLLRDKFMGDTK